MNLFSRLFDQQESAQIAKERLQLVLAHDRMSIPPATLNALKDEIVEVISNHIAIDRANVDVQVTRGTEGNRLVMNIPVLGLRERAARSAARSAGRRRAK